jgi:hypothetical protein
LLLGVGKPLAACRCVIRKAGGVIGMVLAGW